ncbi:hypothetical protein XA68_18449 [Ophiocordyceps unilateralis]|uniref:Uncharacterized protein n=1 Tax=Ophiocordyceps unilateralis TaxID=268505 RepID=A0A2A9PJH8_OPHUN|nr:hypothetical protein XA68_18449 [Ophiocordyceps unilateralis]
MTPAAAGPRLIILAGAPAASAVDEASCTVKRFDEAYRLLLGVRVEADDDDDDEDDEEDEDEDEKPSEVAWRAVTESRRPVPLAMTAAAGDGDDDVVSFLSTARLPRRGGEGDDEKEDEKADEEKGEEDEEDEEEKEKEEEEEEAWTQFCEESLALCASQPSASDSDEDDSMLDSTSILSTMPSSPSQGMMPPPPRSLTVLSRIPSGRRIQAVQPQTLTVNLVVAIMSIAPRRRVTTRWGQTVQLVELLVGDETASALTVTFWLSPTAAAGAAGAAGAVAAAATAAAVTAAADDATAAAAVDGLRRQDVVLLRNVALQVFRGKVFGQSLRRGVTRVSLLWRASGGGCFSARRLAAAASAAAAAAAAAADDDDDDDGVSLVRRAAVVKDWVLRFVGRDVEAGTGHRGKSWDRPPDDTQL